MSKRLLEPTSRFEHALKRSVGKSPARAECVAETLHQMESDLFQPRLKTHALSGKLKGFHACSCGHDCRIVFALRSGPDRIVLINVGPHAVVY